MDRGNGRRFAAFVSYRRSKRDHEHARWLHSKLESFRTPPSLVAELGIRDRVGKVFLDDAELPAVPNLDAALRKRLDDSEHLIVVCSPRTPDSDYIDMEVQHFQDSGRADEIITWLIEGKPEQSFPRALLEAAASGLALPGAADTTPSNLDTPRRRRRLALLRIVARLLGCDVGDLVQRDAARRGRRLLWLLAIAGILSLAMAILVLVTIDAKEEAHEAARKEREAREKAEHNFALALQEKGEAALRSKNHLAAQRLFAEALTFADTPRGRELLLSAVGHLHLEATSTHRPTCNALAFDPTGRLVAEAGSPGNCVRIWDFESGREIARLLPPPVDDTNQRGAANASGDPIWAEGQHRRWVMCLRFDARGDRLLSGSADRTARLWNVKEQKTEIVFEGHAKGVVAVAFLRQRVVSTDESGPLRIWDATTGLERFAIPVAGHVTALAGSVDGKSIACGLKDGTVVLWEAPWKVPHATFAATDQPVAGLAFDATGGVVRAVFDDGTRVEWSMQSKKARTIRTPRPSAACQAAALSPDGRHAVLGFEDGGVTCSVTGENEPVPRYRHRDAVKLVAVGPDGTRIASTSGAGLMFWTSSARRTLMGHRAEIKDLAVSPDGELVASVGFDGLFVWNARTLRLQAHVTQTGPVTCVAFDRGGTRVATAGREKLSLWTRSDSSMRSVPSDGRLTDVDFTPDGTRILACSLDGRVRAW
ncbi:MAG: hypothetical protein V3T86_03475, partial [Planctomycetota bacterium]